MLICLYFLNVILQTAHAALPFILPDADLSVFLASRLWLVKYSATAAGKEIFILLCSFSGLSPCCVVF